MKRIVLFILLSISVLMAGSGLSNYTLYYRGWNKNLQRYVSELDSALRAGTKTIETQKVTADTLTATTISGSASFDGTTTLDTLNFTICAGQSEFDDKATFDSIAVNNVDGGTTFSGTTTVDTLDATIIAGQTEFDDLATFDSVSVATATITTLTSAPQTADGVGAVAGENATVVEYGSGDIIHKAVITCDSTTITISDDAGVAQYGGVKIYDFPEGAIVTMGAVIDGSIETITGTFIATFDGDVALGTATATTGATLTGTEADIMPSVALTQAISNVANCDAVPVATALTESGSRWFDGTATAKDLFLNFVIDDDVTHTAGTAAFTGTVTIYYINIGDK